MSESLAITARVSRDLYELVRMTKQQIVDCNLSFSKSFRFPKCLIYCSDWIFRPHRGFSGSCQTIRYAQGEQILGWKLSPVVLYHWLTLRNTTWLSFQPNCTTGTDQSYSFYWLMFFSISPKVIDENTGEKLGPNEIGEICVKSPYTMREYLANPQVIQICRHYKIISFLFWGNWKP